MIEHLCDIIPKAQSWLVLNLAVFMLVCIHFNVPRPEQQIWLEMYQMKRFIDMEHSLCLPVCFCFYQLGLCSEVIQLMNTTLFITFVLL